MMLALVASVRAEPLKYLFIGHPRSDDSSPQSVQRPVERLDYSRYALVMGGGDYTTTTTASTNTMVYLDKFLHLTNRATMLAMGNHDTTSRAMFTNATKRNSWYAHSTNGITFVVLDTTENTAKISGAQLAMVSNTVMTLSNQSHLVVIHHHIIWLRGNPDLDYLMSSTNIASSTTGLTTNQLNFYSEVYPLLMRAQSNGVQVVCVAGDRTSATNIEHQTAEGLVLLATGLLSTAPPNDKSVIEFEHDVAKSNLTWKFTLLSEITRIPDDDLVISEVHYAPPPAQSNDAAFVELFNRGVSNRDLSRMWFSSGIGFTFPTGAVLGAGQRLIIAANSNRYAGLGVPVFDWGGNSTPTNGAPLWLRDRFNLEMDYVKYGKTAPWPTTPSNSGPSLVLIDPFADNELPENWTFSDFSGGSPGQFNLQLPVGGVGAGASDVQWSGLVSGRFYRVESATDLQFGDWTPMGSTFMAETNLLTITDTNASSGARFQRLRREF